MFVNLQSRAIAPSYQDHMHSVDCCQQTSQYNVLSPKKKKNRNNDSIWWCIFIQLDLLVLSDLALPAKQDSNLLVETRGKRHNVENASKSLNKTFLIFLYI